MISETHNLDCIEFMKGFDDGYFDKRFWEEGINADPKGIVKFNGVHPEILKKHPYYNTKIIKD